MINNTRNMSNIWDNLKQQRNTCIIVLKQRNTYADLCISMVF